MCAGCLACGLCTEQVAKPLELTLKAVSDNFNKLQNRRAHFTAVGPVLKQSGPLQNRPARFKWVPNTYMYINS